MPSFTRRRLVVVLAFFCCAIVALAKFSPIGKAITPGFMLVPAMTATNQDSLSTDVDTDGRADPGDTLKYTVVITNGGTDATGVSFMDTLSGDLSLVNG